MVRTSRYKNMYVCNISWKSKASASNFKKSEKIFLKMTENNILAFVLLVKYCKILEEIYFFS